MPDFHKNIKEHLFKIGPEKICLNVTNQRVFSVADQKPSIIKLMDYYAPSKQVIFET